MISKNQIKFIRSLGQKKFRDECHAFVAEGPKIVGDLLSVRNARLIAATERWLSLHEKTSCDTYCISEEELQKISFLQHPQDVVAVFDKPESVPPPLPGSNTLTLALDGIQDPGNLGTIVRIADWFGIERIYCSTDTADLYNPKVVQATMGSIARVSVYYCNLPELLTQLPVDYPVYGTLLDGNDIYAQQLSPNGLIVMGNEGKGISERLRPLIKKRLLIPSFAKTQASHAESLNVAIATAITCAEFRRRIHT